MEQQPAQQPGAADALRGRELMRLPAQSRGVSRSRSRSPISQHPDGGDSDEEYHRRVRAEETKVNVVLAKISGPAAGHDMIWGLPAFDDTKTLVGFYLRDFDDGEILFEPAWALSNLLPADVALARYGYDREMKEKSDAVHSLFQYDSVENLRDAAYRYYLRHDKPELPGPRPSLQIPAHLIYLVPEADFHSLMSLLDNIDDEYFQLDTPLQLRQLAVAAAPGTMDASRLFELVDAGFASFEPRKILDTEPPFEGLLLDDGQHLPIEALPAIALLRVHADAFQDRSLCCTEPLYLLKYESIWNGTFLVKMGSKADGHQMLRVILRNSHLQLMSLMIRKAVFTGVGFRRYLYHC